MDGDRWLASLTANQGRVETWRVAGAAEAGSVAAEV
jgi:hypothetical protein